MNTPMPRLNTPIPRKPATPAAPAEGIHPARAKRRTLNEALTDVLVKKTKATGQRFKLTDGRGLHLLVTPSGSKLWRFNYLYGGQAKTLALGIYPDVSLALARTRHQAARTLLAQGIDPAAQRLAERLANFAGVALAWFNRNESTWAPAYAVKVKAQLDKDILPYLGKLPISKIDAPLILSVLQRIQERGAIETAHRAKTNIGGIFRFAIAKGLAKINPCPDLKDSLKTPEEKHYASPAQSPEKTGELLRAFDAFKGTAAVKAALLLAPLVFVRPGELRQAKWEDIDLAAKQWRFISSKTKQKHLVPLSRQALAILSDLHPLTGEGEWVFPSELSGQPLSDAALRAALRRLGISKDELTPHGWRSVARTQIHERLNYQPAVIEHQLAHKVPDALGSAYNRTLFLEERVKMMQDWADYLDGLKASPPNHA